MLRALSRSPAAPRGLPPLHAQLLADGADCAHCPLGRHGVPGRPVPSHWIGAEAPPVAIVGEAPGRKETMWGQPFVGPSGKLLDLACRQGGVNRTAELAILNAAACGPIPRDHDAIKAAAVAACRPRLLAELRRFGPRVILAVGASALRTLSAPGTGGVTALRGALVPLAEDVNGKNSTGVGKNSSWNPVLFSTFHPAHILQGGDGEQDSPHGDTGPAVDVLYYFFLADVTKAARYARGEVRGWRDDLDLFALDEHKELRRVGEFEDGTVGFGEIAQPEEFAGAVERVRDEGRAAGEVAEDVETDGKDSLTVGLTANALCAPAGGVAADWPAWRSSQAARALMREINADARIRKIFHNKIFDAIVLARHGFPVVGPVDDTMLQHHGAFPGLSHKLDQVATQFFVTRAWKAEFRHSTRNPAELVLYNGRDAQATVRLRPALAKMLEVHRTSLVYEVDRQLASVATRMREVGYFVDRKEQARQSKVQHARLDYMRNALESKFQAIEDEWRLALARRLANVQRKKDPDDYLERVDLRWGEIAERERKDTNIGLFKPKAKADIVALFEVLRIPFTSYTPKGAPVTDKKAMEAASRRHPLMRKLVHLREASNVLALFIDGLPIVRDGRVHPDWRVDKITGRWSAGKAQNFVYDIPGWPPERDPATGQWKVTPSGEYVTVRENPRAQVSAPTAAEILALPFGAVPLPILARARAGYGRILIGADEGQIELRIAGYLSGDPFLCDGFATGFDPHAVFARICFHPHFGQLEEEFAKYKLKPKADLAKADLDDITRAKLKKAGKQWKRLRDLTKRCEYGAIYGGEPAHLWEALVRDFPELTIENVAETVRRIEQQCPAVVAQRNRWEVEARANREIREGVFGRVRFFPLGNFNPNVVYNFPIQSFASSIIALSIFRFVAVTNPKLLQLGDLYSRGLLDPKFVAKWRPRYEVHAPVELLLNGHDSLIVEADEEDGELVRELLEDAMTLTFEDGGRKMLFPAEAAIGRRWNET